MGLEHYKWSDMPDARHNGTVPYTRNVSGPMDYTPLGFSNPNRNTTHAHQLALPVVFDSGVTHYALSIFYMEPWAGARFLRRTRARYEGVKLLAGSPGRDAAMLRYAEGEYFIGAITTLAQTMTLPLSFLPEGEWQAELYEDDDKDQMLRVSARAVTRDDSLPLRLLANGGAAVYIARELAEPKGGEREGWMCDRAVMLLPKDARLGQGSEPFRWREDQAGVLLSGYAEWTLDAERDGLYTLRVTYASEADWALAAGAQGEADVSEQIPASRSHWDLRSHDVALRLHQGQNVLRLRRAGGDTPALAYARVLDNRPQASRYYPATGARLGRGAELVQKAPDAWDATRLGGETDIVFAPVYAEQAGRYILNIGYCGGESRDLSIEVNGANRVDTYLHCTAGWGFPRWDRFEGKEVLVTLQAGDNEIRLFNKRGAMSHIRGVTLTPDW